MEEGVLAASKSCECIVCGGVPENEDGVMLRDLFKHQKKREREREKKNLHEIPSVFLTRPTKFIHA